MSPLKNSVLQTQVDIQSEAYQENLSVMQQAIQAFRDIELQQRQNEESKRSAFTKAGKLLPRERLSLLLDPGSSFIELAPLAGHLCDGDKDGSSAGGGSIAGIGRVSGVRCLIQVNNSAVKGGTISPTGLKKILRIQQVALDNKLPLLTLAESGGANLNHAAEIFVEGARAFANQARLSATGIPQITVVHGNATAGGAYQPGLSDYVVVVKNQAKMFLAGPPLLRAATGEVADDESLGGAQLHATVSGSAEYIAEDDAEGIAIAREIINIINWNSNQSGINQKSDFEPPLYSADELAGLIPANPKIPFDMREVIARLVDGSKFVEFKKAFDSGTLCGNAKIEGIKVGIIANNTSLTAQGAGKAAQFIQLCEQTATPLVFLHNTTGFLVGTQSERAGIIRQGSKMIQAVANAKVAKISIVIGGSYGAGNYAMCGRGFDPRFIFSWPTSRTAVMGGAQAGKVLSIITEEKWRKQGKSPDKDALQKLEHSTAAALDATSTALFGSAHLWDDGIIDPADTRTMLGLLLDICAEAEERTIHPSSFGVPRH